MRTFNPGRGLVRRLGLAAAAILVIAASSQQPAQALSLASPGTAPATKAVTDSAMIQVRGHGGGGHGGGGHGGGGGFRGGGGGFHGGGFHGGGFRAAPVFRGGGGGGYRAFHYGGYRHVYAPRFVHRHHFRRFYGPSYYPAYYGYPHRYCRVVWTYYGPRKICRYRPWHHRHHWRPHRHHYRYW